MNRIKISAIVFLALFVYWPISGQGDYFGAGNDTDIKVTTSHDYQRTGWNQNSAGDKTINGDGLYARLLETSRFLSQAAMGASIGEIEAISDMEYEEWIDEQMDKGIDILHPEYLHLQIEDSYVHYNNWKEKCNKLIDEAESKL